MFVAYLFIPLPSSGSAAVKLHLTGAILNILQMGKPMLRQLLQVKASELESGRFGFKQGLQTLKPCTTLCSTAGYSLVLLFVLVWFFRQGFSV